MCSRDETFEPSDISLLAELGIYFWGRCYKYFVPTGLPGSTKLFLWEFRFYAETG